jgi:hypothetical protein
MHTLNIKAQANNRALRGFIEKRGVICSLVIIATTRNKVDKILYSFSPGKFFGGDLIYVGSAVIVDRSQITKSMTKMRRYCTSTVNHVH